MSTILFYDSGMGGLSTLRETIKRLKGGRFVYFADNANCPYGDKSPQEIEKLVKERLNWLLKRYKAEMVVFACNTITTACINKIRPLYDIDFVGTEPAISLAMKNSFSQHILLLCTRATARQSRVAELIKRSGRKVEVLPLSGLAESIEKNEEEEIWPYIEKICKEIKKYPDIDAIVLGCTHYCFIKDRLESELKTTCYDGNQGVAKQVERLLNKNGQKPCKKLKIKVIVSSGEPKVKKMYQKMVMKIKV